MLRKTFRMCKHYFQILFNTTHHPSIHSPSLIWQLPEQRSPDFPLAIPIQGKIQSFQS